MSKLDSGLQKKIKKKSTSGLGAFQKSRRKKGTGIFSLPDKNNVEFIKEEIKGLIKMFPGSPEFLGRPEYTIKKKKLGFLKRKYPDISELREQVNKFSAKESISDSRPQIRKLLKRYPAYPDLRALNAIQIISDVSQSGLDSKKLKVIQGSLREITRAIYNDGLSLFNINWFFKIYIRYLDALREKYLQTYNNTRTHYKKEIKQLANHLRRKQIQLTVMSVVKTKLSSLELLNAKLKDTSYTISGITVDDVKRASQAIKNGDVSKKIGDEGKTAANVIYIITTLNLLFARVPILKKLVSNLQGAILDMSQDIILQKIMVINMQRMTDFQLHLAAGNQDKTRDIAKKMYIEQQEIIKQYLNQGVLTKQYEIDPFIKTAWIVKESRGLFEDDDYRKMLENAFKIIDVLFSKRVQVKGAAELAGNMQDDIQFRLIEAGWTN